VHRIPIGDARASGAAAARPEAAVRARLVESVARLLPHDRGAGLLLSGGVDSSTVAALIRRDLGIQLDTFSLVFGDVHAHEDGRMRFVTSTLCAPTQTLR
jgi:asparagine synthetase B (glutamine-hydrolysing)